MIDHAERVELLSCDEVSELERLAEQSPCSPCGGSARVRRRMGMMAVATGMSALMGTAWLAKSGHLGRLAADGQIRLEQLKDSDHGRCLTATTRKPGENLVLGKCNPGSPDQAFTLNKESNTISIQDDKGQDMCLTQAGFETKDGRPLLLDQCRPGYDLQWIVGMCFKGDTPNVGTQAFVKPCGPQQPVPEMGTSLFCWMVIIPDSFEVELKNAAEARASGIYGCDEHKVYKGWDTGEKFDAGNDGQYAVNAVVFLKMWQEVFKEERYMEHDWTVKVDPDTVWLPDRLRGRLAAFGAHINKAVYVKNTELSFGFLGPIEIISQLAVVKLAEHSHNNCSYTDHQGEDGWLVQCMDRLGFGFQTDTKILNSLSRVGECWNQDFVAFHFYKDADSWNACLDSSVR